MATITALTVADDTLALGGQTTGQVVVEPDHFIPDRDATVTVEIDGRTGTGVIHVAGRPEEILEYTTDASRAGQPGVVVLTVDLGSVAFTGTDGSFTYTAPSA